MIANGPSLDLVGLLSGVLDQTPSSDDELIPVRMLNEFAYCPRLAFLEWVQGEFVDNLDTRQGTFGHRNVDQPTSAPVPEADSVSNDAAPLTARALMVSAPVEGLVAKLDLLELDGHVATPVEYKKGAIPANAEQAWEPERVQLCAQGLILRENGYTSNAGELYYIESRHRVSVPFDDTLILRTRFLIGRLREMSRSGQMPPPLVDSPKCPRCSLVGICLPDETNLLRKAALPQHSSTALADAPQAEVDIEKALPPLSTLAASHGLAPASTGLSDSPTLAASATALSECPTPAATTTGVDSPVRKLLPARDDALPLYVKEQGAFVGKDGDRLHVRQREAKLASVPLIGVSQVSLFGNVQMSSQALREVVDRGIPVCHFSYGGWFQAMTIGHDSKNVALRIAQFAAAADPASSLRLARGFITAKIRNSRTLLRRHAERAADRTIGSPDRELNQLAEWIDKASRAESAATLLGLEGMAAKTYFAGFARLLKGDNSFDLTCRNRRPPRDPVNAVLSFVYALLVKEVTIAVRSVGFDPLLGFFHTPHHGRPSLALDLAEEFRPIIGDSVVMTVINNAEVSSSSFVSRAGAVALTESGRKSVIAAFERRLEHEVTHPIFGYRITYRRILEVQARLLSRTVLGELDEYPGFCTR